jgi:hypothetical protein
MRKEDSGPADAAMEALPSGETVIESLLLRQRVPMDSGTIF